jgi:tetratricopeptide (TPR) repeat protein
MFIQFGKQRQGRGDGKTGAHAERPHRHTRLLAVAAFAAFSVGISMLSPSCDDSSDRTPREKAQLINGYGVAEDRAGEHIVALMHFADAMGADSSFAPAYSNCGATFAELGDSATALRELAKALSIDPNYAAAYTNRGAVYAQFGDLDRAIADFSHAILINPKSAPAYQGLGHVYAAKGDYDRAIAAYDTAISDSGYAGLYNDRGVAREAKKDYFGAQSDFTQAIDIDPKCATAFLNRGKTSIELGDRKSAIEDYSLAIRADSGFADAYYARGYEYSKNGEHASAKADFAKAVQVSAIACRRLGYTYGMIGAHDRAIRVFTEAIRLNPNADAYTDRGEEYCAKGDSARGKEDYAKAARLKGNAP